MRTAIAVGTVAALAGAAHGQADRAYAAGLLADADARTSLLDDGQASFDPDRGMGIVSGDNALHVRFFQDFRYYAAFRGIHAPGQNDDVATGFQNARTRVCFRADLGEDVTGVIHLETSDPSSSMGELSVLDGFIDYRIDDRTEVRIGQFKHPLLASYYMVSPVHVLTVERSILSDFFATGRQQGVRFSWTADDVQLLGSLSDGVRTANTDFTSMSEADFAVIGRVNWKLLGEWTDLHRTTSFQGDDESAYIGGAFLYQTGGNTNGTADEDLAVFTLDGAWRGDGWNLRGEAVAYRLDASGGPEFTHFGFNAQGGLFVSSDLELFASWDSLLLDDDAAAITHDVQNFLTLGGRWFPFGESYSAVVVGDVVFALEETADLAAFSASGVPPAYIPNTRQGLFGDTGTGETAFRLSLRLLF